MQQGSQLSSHSSPHLARRCCPCLGIMGKKFLESHNCHLAHLASPASLPFRRMDPVTFRHQTFLVLGIRNLPLLHRAATLAWPRERGKSGVLDACRLPIPVCFHQRQGVSFRMLVMYFRNSKLVASVGWLGREVEGYFCLQKEESPTDDFSCPFAFSFPPSFLTP